MKAIAPPPIPLPLQHSIRRFKDKQASNSSGLVQQLMLNATMKNGQPRSGLVPQHCLAGGDSLKHPKRKANQKQQVHRRAAHRVAGNELDIASNEPLMSSIVANIIVERQFAKTCNQLEAHRAEPPVSRGNDRPSQAGNEPRARSSTSNSFPQRSNGARRGAQNMLTKAIVTVLFACLASKTGPSHSVGEF